MCLESNGHGQLPLKTVRKLMMVPKNSKDIVNYFESAKTVVHEKVFTKKRKERERGRRGGGERKRQRQREKRQRQSQRYYLTLLQDDSPYIEVSEFTEEIYMNLIDTLLQNRGPDLDVLKKEW